MTIINNIEQCHSLLREHPYISETNFNIQPKASNLEISQIESRLKIEFPESLKRLFLEIASELKFTWVFDDERLEDDDCYFQTEDGEDLYFGGGVIWSMNNVEQLLQSHSLWSETREKWQGTFPVFHIANGDMIGVDIKSEKVMYLSHEDDEEEIQSFQLNQNLEQFFTVWSLLACPGPEFWILDSFMHENSSKISSDTLTGTRWLEYLKG
ncbi:MAG: hypothetical protein HRT89_12600 [Lentisphaeria bacterium]|nr:SMI1/KNR4 family protein [Lentisphaeria bacterium]NQZ68897.1 hypothetical protein [Lentisphaeria bacterium]